MLSELLWLGLEKIKQTVNCYRLRISEGIKYLSAIDSSPSGGNIHWELLLIIPVDIFIYHELDSLRSKFCRANFYKCGDKLPEPHFISWSAIHSPEPDFHLPDFFGELYFE